MDESLDKYLAFGYEVASVLPWNDLSPAQALAWRTEQLADLNANVAIRREGMLVVRFSTVGYSDDDMTAVESCFTDDTPCIVAENFRQWLVNLPVAVRIGEIGGVGPLSNAVVLEGALAPPSRLMTRKGTIERLAWTKSSNISPGKATAKLIAELIAATRLPRQALNLLDAMGFEPA